MISVPGISDIVQIPSCNEIIDHPLYVQEFEKLQKLEEERQFCRHTFEHFLDVARIAYIINLEKGFNLSKNVIYAVALLHDIGRARQYEDGISHEEAGADIAGRILNDCGFINEDIDMIINAIKDHRTGLNDSNLSKLIYFADKASRLCFKCKESGKCNWSSQKKNLNIII